MTLFASVEVVEEVDNGGSIFDLIFKNGPKDNLGV